MSVRTSIIATACVAAIIPMALSAQQTARRDTTRTRQPTVFSQQRVALQKDYGTPRRDLAQERADSIANAERMRADALARTEAEDRARLEAANRAFQRERDSIANFERNRADSTINAERARQEAINAAYAAAAVRDSMALDAERKRHVAGFPFHVGIAAGGAMPNGDFKSVGYNSGVAVDVPIEWHRPSSLLGLRLDLGYSQFSSDPFAGLNNTGTPVTLDSNDPKVISAALNLTAHMPLTSSHKVNLYALGGAGLYHFRGVARGALSGLLGNDVFDATQTFDPGLSTSPNKTKVGAQAGGGIDFAFGHTALFVESRFVNVFAHRTDNVAFNNFFGTDRSNNLRWVPIVVGVTVR